MDCERNKACDEETATVLFFDVFLLFAQQQRLQQREQREQREQTEPYILLFCPKFLIFFLFLFPVPRRQKRLRDGGTPLEQPTELRVCAQVDDGEGEKDGS